MITFPTDNLQVNDTYTHTPTGKTWKWTGAVWQLQPRILTSADITDFETKAQDSAKDASKLSTGTLPDARLSAGVTASLGKADSALQSGAAISTISGLQTALDAKIPSTEKGATNGVATLDSSGKVPSTQLPSYVDDVLEYANLEAIQADTTNGRDNNKIYVALDTNKIYRWSGSALIEISPSPGTTDAVPEGSNNKYFLESRVLGSVLAGFVTATTNATIAATDSVLSAFAKVQKQISDAVTSIDAKQIKAVYSDTAPTHAAGLEWVDTTTLRSYRSYNGAWVEIDRA